MDLSGLIVWLLAIGVAWLFRCAYLGWFGVFVLWFVILMPPLLSTLSLPAMLSIRLQPKAPESAMHGENVELQLLFHCARRLPVGKVRLKLRIDNLYTGETRREDYSFDAVQESIGVVSIPSDACGALRMTVERWTCADVLGQLVLRRKCPPPVVCVILPRPAEPDTAVLSEAVPESQPRMKPKYGGGYAEDHELRAYRPGDSMNSVHWKLSSKIDELIVREAQVPDNDRIYLILQEDGKSFRGLQSLFWLSQQLNQREEPHWISANRLYPVTDEASALAAIRQILSSPRAPALPFSYSDARVLYTVNEGEVSVC